MPFQLLSALESRQRKRRRRRGGREFQYHNYVVLLSMLWAVLARNVSARKTAPTAFSSRFISQKSPRRQVAAALQQLRGRYFPPPIGYPKQQYRHTIQWQAAKKSTIAATTTKTTKSLPKPSSSDRRPYKLVIVESPSKCKTIEKILQKYVQENQLEYDFVVTSCYGHIRNLPKNNQQLLEANLHVPSKNDTAANFPYQIVGIDLQNNYNPTYVLLPGKGKLVRELQTLADQAEQVLLATDPDREGEAIAWHLQEVLKCHNSERLTFSEITPKAIEAAVTSPRMLNENLVQAQETRRILDRLAGFTVSPVLWKKIAPGLSAGRVQSVGMALCVQRERERLVFQPTNYWDILGNFTDKGGIAMGDSDIIEATLISVNGTSLVSGKQDLQETPGGKPKPKRNKLLLTEPSADELLELLRDPSTEWTVTSVEGRERFSFPPEPFKTSTLQQETNHRLGLSVSQTMRTAQQLYEAGWISYMRTDASHLSDDAKASTMQAIRQKHGPNKVFQQKKSGTDKKKSRSDKYAQEAHEAIRPAIQPSGSFAESVSGLPEIAQSLYKLIYQRTLASHMPPQKVKQTTIVIEGTTVQGTAVEFRATGSVVLDPGFTAEWSRGDGSNKDLPPVVEGQFLSCHELDPISHTTQPPPRYTEASLVKELEALGVGRPSTYAGIVQILRDRAYVGSPVSDTRSSRNNKVATGSAITAQRAAGGGDLFGARGPLVPSLSAFVVTSLLEKHCPTYVDPAFTAHMEENLDRIAQGTYTDEQTNVEQQRIAYLNEFYAGDEGLAAKIKRIEDEVEAEEARKAALPSLNTTGEKDNSIDLLIGPWGPYIQKTNGHDEPLKAPLPAGMATDLSTITTKTLQALLEAKEGDGHILGQHPEDGRNIRLKVGRFGAYLQWGETGEENTTTHSLPKQVSAMRNIKATEETDDSEDMPTDIQSNVTSPAGDGSLGSMLGLTIEEAVGYCGLPRTVSMLHDKPIVTAIGPYGPYLKYNNTFMSLSPRDGDVLTIDAETAEQLVTEGIINKKSGSSRGVIANLGEKEGNAVTIKSGRFGSYINWKKVNAKLPAEYMEEPETMSLEEAWALIQEKASSPNTRSRKSDSRSRDDLPPAPKRPKSAYLHFCDEKRPEVASKGASIGDISRKLAELWAETTPEGRKTYEELAEKGKAAYLVEKAAWEEQCKKQGVKRSTPGKSKVAGKKDIVSPRGPKRPKSAYLFFCDAMRPEVSKTVTRLGDVSKELARLWGETTDRSEYEALASHDKKRYAKEKAAYEEKLGASMQRRAYPPSPNVNGATNHRAVNGSPTSRIATENSQSKPKRALSAYMIFCREKRNSVVDENGNKLPLGETTKRLAEMWKNCDAETRAEFEAMAEREKQEMMAGQS